MAKISINIDTEGTEIGVAVDGQALLGVNSIDAYRPIDVDGKVVGVRIGISIIEPGTEGQLNKNVYYSSSNLQTKEALASSIANFISQGKK